MFWVTVGCMTDWFYRVAWSLVYTLGWVICINSIYLTSKKWDFGMKINFPKHRRCIQRSPPS